MCVTSHPKPLIWMHVNEESHNLKPQLRVVLKSSRVTMVYYVHMPFVNYLQWWSLCLWTCSMCGTRNAKTAISCMGKLYQCMFFPGLYILCRVILRGAHLAPLYPSWETEYRSSINFYRHICVNIAGVHFLESYTCRIGDINWICPRLIAHMPKQNAKYRHYVQ